MFSTNLNRPLLALAVTAGLLAVAGPASAQIGPASMGVTTPHPGSKAPANATGLKSDTEITDYVRLSTASDVDTLRMGVMDYTDAVVDKDLNQPDMGVREQPTQVNAPQGLSIGSSEVFELNTIRSNGDGSGQVAGPAGLKFDSNEVAEDNGFTAPPEMDANANASMPDVDDEVLASIYYEPDFF
jgi:hypothetical protein